MIRRGEELGFETTLIAERWMGTDHSAWMLASALAALTSRIELMVAVHPGIMTPQAVAKLAVSLDRISGGRAAINIVNGWWKEEFETFGHGWQPQDDDARYRRMDEFVRVLRGLWQEDVFDFHGEFYTVDRPGPAAEIRAIAAPADLCRNPQRDWQGSHRARRRLLVRRLPDRLPDVGAQHRAGRGLHRRYEKARGGPWPHYRFRHVVSCHLRRSTGSAVDLANQLEEHGKTISNRVAFIAAKALGPGLVGTPEQIADRIRRYEAAGVGTLMMHFHPMMEGMERFARRGHAAPDGREV